MAELSTKPYLIRAIHAWCSDSGYRPYIAVIVDEHTIVPREYVRNGEIVLNVSEQATNRLRIGPDLVEFEARFSGVVRSVSIPIDNVSAIYAQETGHGMAFDVPKPAAGLPAGPVESTAALEVSETSPAGSAVQSGKRATLAAVPDTGSSRAAVAPEPSELPRKASKGPRVVAPRSGGGVRGKVDPDAVSAAKPGGEGEAAAPAPVRAKPAARRLRAVQDGQHKTVPVPDSGKAPEAASTSKGPDDTPPDEPPPGRPYLKRIK
jgi:stringent starvation protein B